MDVQLHHDLAEFVALTRPLLEGDPVRHTIALTVTNVLMRAPEAGDPPILLTVRRGESLTGAAICTPPWALIVSALPAGCAGAAVEALARGYPSLPGAVGPRDETEAFAENWSARTSASVHERMAQRLFALHGLNPPVGVRGTARQAGAGDLEQLAQWRQDFADEATGGLRGRSIVGTGYGSAVTAAVAGWARQAGAKHVVLFTDLANPVTNVIYPRIGFRPVHDAVEFDFTPAPCPQSGVRTR